MDIEEYLMNCDGLKTTENYQGGHDVNSEGFVEIEGKGERNLTIFIYLI